MKKQFILGTGLNGMVGSRIVELLSDQFVFENMSRSEGIDITDSLAIEQKIKNSEASIVLHLAAKADVDACELDKEADIGKYQMTNIPVYQYTGRNNSAWEINVIGTKNVADACKKFGKKLIYISTDFVFDGENPPEDGYSEDDTPNPVDWYGRTKYEGEKVVQSSGVEFVIARIAYPFRAQFAAKKDFMRAILERLKNNQPITAVADQIIIPTFIDDIANALKILIKKNEIGIFHVVGSQSLSPYSAALKIAETFDLDKSLISKTTAEEFFRGRAKRPFHLVLSNAKIRKLGIRMKTFEEALREVKSD